MVGFRAAGEGVVVRSAEFDVADGFRFSRREKYLAVTGKVGEMDLFVRVRRVRAHIHDAVSIDDGIFEVALYQCLEHLDAVVDPGLAHAFAGGFVVEVERAVCIVDAVVGANQGEGVQLAQGVAPGLPRGVLAGGLGDYGLGALAGKEEQRGFARERFETVAVLQGGKVGVERFALVLGHLRFAAQYDFVQAFDQCFQRLRVVAAARLEQWQQTFQRFGG